MGFPKGPRLPADDRPDGESPAANLPFSAHLAAAFSLGPPLSIRAHGPGTPEPENSGCGPLLRGGDGGNPPGRSLAVCLSR